MTCYYGIIRNEDGDLLYGRDHFEGKSSCKDALGVAQDRLNHAAHQMPRSMYELVLDYRQLELQVLYRFIDERSTS